MKRLVQLLLLMCVLPFLGGCATIALANNPSAMSRPDGTTGLGPVYSRSQCDLMVIYLPIWAFTPANDKNVGFAKEFATILGPFMMVGGIVDLPISVTVDTLTLPWDIWRSNKKSNIEDESRDSAPKTAVSKPE